MDIHEEMAELGEQTDLVVEALRRMLAEFGDHCHYYECPANEDGPCDCFAGNLVIDCLDVLGKAILEKKQG